MRVRWLLKARAGLDAELQRIALEDTDAAVRLAAVFMKRTERLAQFLESGRPGRVAGTRELVIDGFPYIVPYRVRDEVVEILRVFHTSQKLPGSW